MKKNVLVFISLILTNTQVWAADRINLMVSPEEYRILKMAAVNGDDASVNKELENLKGSSGRSRYLRGQNKALTLAAINKHDSTVQMIMKRKQLSPSCKGNALRAAAWNGCDSIVALLLADQTINAHSVHVALFYAAKNRHDSTVDLLLSDPRVNVAYVAAAVAARPEDFSLLQPWLNEQQQSAE